jgi:ABC-type transport system involved in cytochrome bd biosynthesis fused ATPase/permease subunit
MPPLVGAPKPKPPIPREIHVAFWVWVLSTVLSSVLQILDSKAFVEILRKQMAAASSPEVQFDQGTAMTIYIIAVVAVAALMLLFAWKMRAGRNWARVVLAVLAVLGLWNQARSVGLSEPLAVVGALITATALVFMFVPAAHAYFAQFRRPRQ